jgi:hypothetical protein
MEDKAIMYLSKWMCIAKGSVNTPASNRFGSLDTLILFTAFVSMAVFFFNIHKNWDFTVDDAFITARYAQNAAEGYGVVWNRHGEPIEGFTHPAWFAVLTAAAYCGADPIFTAKLAGVLFSSALLCVLPFLTKRFLESWKQGVMAACLVSIVPLTGIHAVAGLETMGYAFFSLICVFLACFKKVEYADTRWFLKFYM